MDTEKATNQNPIKSMMSYLRIPTSWAQYYKTFYVRDLRIFVIS
jgi:hypothetical protein